MQHLVVGQAQHADAFSREPIVSFLIPLLLAIVDRTVDLDRKPALGAIEVDDTPAERVLPAEPQTPSLPIPEGLPQHLFGARLLPSKQASARP